ncbi:MAG: aminotransferase class IV, partial [Planctomycetales bacterium]|nr:aminotransferase class IV [Planctomycetales bacterium]
NGEYIDADKLSVQPHDAGFLLGATVAEQVRTFGGRPFWLKQHLSRFFNGLRLARIESPVGKAKLHDAAMAVVANNYPLQSRMAPPASAIASDIGITLFATPGSYSSYGVESGPVIAIHTYPLQFQLWADNYQSGRHAVISPIREVPTDCWPKEIKCRSRMHYYLASKEAHERSPGAVPILLDHNHCVAETPIASIIAYFENRGFVAPRQEKILPGVSLAYVKQLAAQWGIPFAHQDMTVEELRSANEVLLTSTPFCVLPLTSIDGHHIGGTDRGTSMYTRVLQAWSHDVSVNIRKQAEDVAKT